MSWIPSERLRVTAYVDNLTNEHYFRSGFSLSALLGSATLVQGQERTMGVELNRRGIAAVLVTLPYHLERTPEGSRSGEMKLLDVNVWLAAAWARHVHHVAAKAFIDAQDDDLGFCRVTEQAFLRLGAAVICLRFLTP